MSADQSGVENYSIESPTSEICLSLCKGDGNYNIFEKSLQLSFKNKGNRGSQW